jgi:hypothetical protein
MAVFGSELTVGEINDCSSNANQYRPAIREASTVKVERSTASNTFTARSERYNRGRIRGSIDIVMAEVDR